MNIDLDLSDTSQPLDFLTRFGVLCSGETTLEMIEGIKRHFDELIPALRGGVFKVRLDLSLILNRILTSSEVVGHDDRVMGGLQELDSKFRAEKLEIEQLRNPVDIYDILIRTRCDSYIQQILDGKVGGIIPLFSLILEGLTGSHPQSDAIKKWFSTMGFSRFADNGRYAYDVDISPIDFSCKSFSPEILNSVQYLESKCNQLFTRNGSDYYLQIRIEFVRIISDIYDMIDPKNTIPRTIRDSDYQAYIHSQYYKKALDTRQQPH